jgi:hypothetical protein
METRIISLPKGGDLEVSLTPEFLKGLKDHFELDSASKVTDDHIRMFIYGATKNALDEAEAEAEADDMEMGWSTSLVFAENSDEKE